MHPNPVQPNTYAPARQWGIIVTAVIHTVLIALLLLPFLQQSLPPSVTSGILVNLGLPDRGQGDNNTPGPPIAAVGNTTAAPALRELPAEVQPINDPTALAIQRQREEETRQKAEAAAQAAAQKRAEADQLKGEISGLFGGGGSGSGKGTTGKPGNQGDPNGDPNADRLTGISTGTGVVGDGLGNRGIVRSPRLEDNSQQTGTVVVRVCVNGEGEVTTVEFTQRGSTISDGRLKLAALNNARQWKFNKGEVNTQCGTITYRFRVQ